MQSALDLCHSPLPGFLLGVNKDLDLKPADRIQPPHFIMERPGDFPRVIQLVTWPDQLTVQCHAT